MLIYAVRFTIKDGIPGGTIGGVIGSFVGFVFSASIVPLIVYFNIISYWKKNRGNYYVLYLFIELFIMCLFH